MILVTLGTQDKSFERLLKAIDKEIERGNIKEKVVVQAGFTKYKSNNMEIFKTIPKDEFENLMGKARIVITHGGVGNILTALKCGKKVIAVPRLSKYQEHTNDHQKQIVDEFSRKGYILALKDFNKLDKLLLKVENFKPRDYISNNDKFKSLIVNYIDDTNHVSWFNQDKRVISASFINLIIYSILISFSINKYLSFTLSYLLALFSMFFKVKKTLKFCVIILCFYLIDGLSLILLTTFLQLNFILAKFIVNIMIILIFHFLYKKK